MKISNKRLTELLSNLNEDDVVSDELARIFILMAKNFCRSNMARKAYVFMDNEELESELIYQLLRNAHKFDPEKGSNGFSYLTTIMSGRMINFIKVRSTYNKNMNAYHKKYGCEWELPVYYENTDSDSVKKMIVKNPGRPRKNEV